MLPPLLSPFQQFQQQLCCIHVESTRSLRYKQIDQLRIIYKNTSADSTAQTLTGSRLQTMKYNEKTKGNGLLPLVNRPAPKSSFPYLLLLLLIPTALYGWYHTVCHHKDRHLFGKKAEIAYLYVVTSFPEKPFHLTFSSAVLYPMKPAQLKPPVFTLQSRTQLGHPVISLPLRIFYTSWRRSQELSHRQLNPSLLLDPQNPNTLLVLFLKHTNLVHGLTLITL